MSTNEQEKLSIINILKSKVKKTKKNKTKTIFFDQEDCFSCSIDFKNFIPTVGRHLEDLKKNNVIENYFHNLLDKDDPENKYEGEYQTDENGYDGVPSPFAITCQNDFIERCDKFIARILKEPKIEFNENGQIMDINNNIEIHKYSEADNTHATCNYLFNRRDRDEWISWDEIAEHMDSMGAKKEVIHTKKQIADIIRGINKYALRGIERKIIENNGQQRYKTLS